MQTRERPPTDPQQTYTQTEAAKLCGITQRSLVDRPGRRGYLSKLHQCFPGQYFEKVAVGSIENQSDIRLTHKGVDELKDLVQALSPEPPTLVDGNLTYGIDGKVLKSKRQPTHNLVQYAEFIWFREGFDGSAEIEKVLNCKSAPTPEIIEAAFVEAEAVSNGQLLVIEQTTEPIEAIIDHIENIDFDFWQEAERRATAGYQQGRFLKSIEIKARTQAESDLEKDYYQRSKNVASRKRTG